MDVALRTLAAGQFDLVAAWQLRELGWTRSKIAWHAQRHGWRVVHPGVYLLALSPPTAHQRWRAATLTTRRSYLSTASAAALWGILDKRTAVDTVVRPGTGGARRCGSLLVFRSSTLGGNVMVHRGVPITTPERTLVDLARMGPKRAGRMLREALRLKLTTALGVAAVAARHPNRTGVQLLNGLAARYASIPYDRTRSDAEARGLEVLHDAAIDPPAVNVRIAGEEADLAWIRRRLIIEIDGPQFHMFAEEDARKQAAWESAGFEVRRIPSDDVYDDPARLVVLAARD